MARGKQDVVVPIEGPVEISNLAHQIQRVKEFLEERKRVEDELRRKNVALKDAKEQSELADQTKSEFLACMSHELRTPLNAIIGFADVMMNGYYGKIENNKYSQYIEDIYNSGQHLLEIINDILDLAKVESGVMALHESRIDVEKLVLKSIRLLSDRAQMSGIILDADMPDRMPVIQGDPLRIKQVLINLLSNAIKYTPEGGHICVKVDYDLRRPMPLTIHVMDTGVGMTPDQIPLALSKFGQVDGDYTKKNQGTGLGLPLSLELMRLHQGTLEIISEYGQGTTASIAFPAARVVMPENELA
jgi:signal transduction histidine kinase